MPIRSSRSDCYKQWATVWQYCLPNILLKVKHQEPIFNALLSTRQRTSGGDKQNPIECTKENVGKHERKKCRQSRGPTWATLFTLSYGMRVIIPTEISMPIVKILMQDQRDNDEELIRQMDWADEMQRDAVIQMASYYQRTIVQYNKKAWPQIFWTGTLVLRRIFENITKVGARKHQAN